MELELKNEHNYDLTLPGIYCIKNTGNGKVYIGSAKVLRNRIWEHRSDLKKSRHKNIHLTRAYEQYGADSFEVFILEIVECLDLLKVREQHWMDFYKSHDKNLGYNISKLAERSTMSEEGRKRLSELRKGKPLSEEHRKAISEGVKGKIVSVETKKKMSESSKGRKISEQTRANMSAAKQISLYRPDPEQIKRMHESNRGRKMSDEERAKRSAAIKKWHADRKANT